MKVVRAIVGQETLPMLKNPLGWVVEVAAFMMQTAHTHHPPSRCQFTQSMNQVWSPCAPVSSLAPVPSVSR